MKDNWSVYTDKIGNKWWLLDGCIHREDGPAVEFVSGEKQYYLNGAYCGNEQDFIYFKLTQLLV